MTRVGGLALKLCRGWVALGLMVSGCGWHPVYLSAAGRDAGVSRALARVDVSIIPERSGQLLRQALQTRLQGAGTAEPAAFVLDAGYAISEEGFGYTPDNSITRVRVTAISHFALHGVMPGSATCVSGSVTQVDGFDEVDQQFFEADMASDSVIRRLSDAVANEIVTKLALALSTPGRAGCDVARL